MSQKHPDASVFRQDLPHIDMSKEELIKFNKTMSALGGVARKETKPDACLICGAEKPKFCESHTIPQYCLKEIAVDGELLTNAAIVGGDLVKHEVGISKAAIFKQICRKCDTEYFKLYETPGSLLVEPSSQIMGQIATKNLLREVSKARHELGLHSTLKGCSSHTYDAMMSVRAIDAEESEQAFKTAVRVGQTGGASDAYHVIFHKVLPYTAPFAFQQMINPIADFDGNLINNSFNPSTRYRIEPIHTCVLPSKGSTVILMFRAKEAKRYRTFEKQLNARDERQRLQAVVKLIFAYSEDVFISKMIDPLALQDCNLVKLSKMNVSYLGFGDSEKDCRQAALKAALREYAIDNLPEPPELLSARYAIVNDPS